MKPKLSDDPKAPAIPEVQVPDFVFSTSDKWELCRECGEHYYTEDNGKQYYHRIHCSKSNGIRYGADRTHDTVRERLTAMLKKTKK